MKPASWAANRDGREAMSRKPWGACALALVVPCAAALAHVGTQPGSSYSWIDDREPGYEFVDARLWAPRELQLDGDAAAPLPLEFPFRYHGRTFDSVQATADG